ncbi:MAG: hypothetical protein ACRCWI_04410 [Brevinema sp.]
MILIISIFFLVLSIPTHLSFSQDAPQSPIIGDELLQPGAGYTPPPTINPDAQLYLPETFSPTAVIPTGREREELLGQTNAVSKAPPIFWGGFTLGAQYGQFDKLPYTDIYLSPYIQVGPLFVAYEIPLRFDWNGTFITRMWNSDAALISKFASDIYYSKTNHTFRHIQVSVYGGEQLFQGHGRFFYDYNPNLYAPYEPFKTFKLSLDVSYIGFNYILANIAQPDLMGIEFYIRPLAGLTNPKIQALKEFKLYTVVGVDLDPFQGVSTTLYEFAPNPLSPTFSMFEVGADLPIFTSQNRMFALNLYGDYSQFLASSKDQFKIQSGSGISGGLLMTFIERIPIRFEISQAIGYWQPRWVNIFYYIDRPYVEDGSVQQKNKYMNLMPDLTYFTSSIAFDWSEKNLFIQAELYGDFSKQDLWLTLSFTLGNTLLKQLSLSIYWTIRQLTQISINEWFDPQYSVIDINLKYHMMPNMYWGILFKINGRISESFDFEGNPTISTVPFIFLGIDFSFRY